MVHPQLLADCHVLAAWSQCHVLLNRNASLPWFILVPQETGLEDLLDLPEGQREQVMNEAAKVARFIKSYWRLPKTNVAQLGNVVSQMHIHVVGRREGDACWPKPIWGNLPESAGYSERELQEITSSLEQFSS